MKNYPKWVLVTIGIGILLLFCGLGFIGIIIIGCMLVYLYRHGYFRNHTRRNTTTSSYKAYNGKTPPRFVRKMDILSDKEMVFKNYTFVKFYDENGSKQLKTIEDGTLSIRLNEKQFDVFIQSNEHNTQLSFEKENIKILKIENHFVSIIEGNQDRSYLKIHYASQMLTDQEVEELKSFFHDFEIQDSTTFIPEEKIKKEMPSVNRKFLIGIGVAVVIVVGIFGYYKYDTSHHKIVINQTTIAGTKSRYIDGLSYTVNVNVEEYERWQDDGYEYDLGEQEIPYVSVSNKVDNVDYTQTYDYTSSSQKELEEYVWDNLLYGSSKTQCDYYNLDNGKWYHLSGVLDKDYYYDCDSDVYADVYVMPTKKSLVVVTLCRTVDDGNDYDIQEFLQTFDFDELVSESA